MNILYLIISIRHFYQQQISLLNKSVIVFLLSLTLSSTAKANDFSVAFYALSRGRGVPEATREVLKQIRSRFTELKDQGEVIKIEEKRIGLEGERRICAEFINESVAQREWARLKEMTKGLDLANLKKEPCN